MIVLILNDIVMLAHIKIIFSLLNVGQLDVILTHVIVLSFIVLSIIFVTAIRPNVIRLDVM
jgi:hypothetical protein